MKKTILLIMAALSVSVAIGQRSLTLSVPKCTTFFKVGAAGLNMRKKPDAGSAKLMVWASDAGSSETVDRYYSVTRTADAIKPMAIPGLLSKPFIRGRACCCL